MRIVRSLWIAFLVGVAGCSAPTEVQPTAPAEVSLTIHGHEADRVEFTIEGGGLDEPITGEIEIVDLRDPEVWTRVYDLPVGTGYVVTLVVRDEDGRILCVGTDTFDIVEGETTKVDIVLVCEAPEPVCGDGRIERGEECDDGNTIGGDGCTSDCMLEGEPGVCGDGIRTPDEECDDGDLVAGDGCTEECRYEWVCEPQTLVCDALPWMNEVALEAILTIGPDDPLVAGTAPAIRLSIDQVFIPGLPLGVTIRVSDVTAEVGMRDGGSAGWTLTMPPGLVTTVDEDPFWFGPLPIQVVPMPIEVGADSVDLAIESMSFGLEFDSMSAMVECGPSADFIRLGVVP